MATGQRNRVIGQLRRAALTPNGAGLTDAQLLTLFIEQRDETAFEALVRRHGPMVFGVCQRRLRNTHDAEDAFQATFLVLVRKAASLKSRETVGNWLFGVANNASLKARAGVAKRRRKETQVSDMPEPEAVQEESVWQDLQPHLDHELSRLPDKYRLPVVLCDLEGRTRNDVATQLQIPEGTLSSRLTTARKMLAKRLAQYRLAVSVGALAAALSHEVASACVPAALIVSTVKAASPYAAGQATATGLISANVAALTKGVLKAMLFTKLKTVAVVLVGLGMVAFTCGMLARGQSNGKGDRGEKPAAKAADTDKPRKDEETIQGTWVAVSAEVEGKEAPAEAIKDLTLVITADKLIFNPQGENRQSSYKLDPAKMPKVIELTPLDGPAKGKAMKNIYRLDGDRLTFCLQNSDGDAPTEFATKANTGLRLLGLKRQAKGQDKAKEATDDKGALQGTWRVLALETDGLRLGEGRPELKDSRVVIAGDSLTLVDPANKEGRKSFGFRLDSFKKPKEIQWTSDKKELFRGIYQVDGDDCKLCFAKVEDVKSPLDFTADFGSKRWCFILKREQGKEQETGAVEGMITLNGKPLEKGKVSFHPEKGNAIEAEIKDGAYSAKGVPAGSVKVTVKAEGVPAAFVGEATTPLRAEVKKGDNTLDLSLQK